MKAREQGGNGSYLYLCCSTPEEGSRGDDVRGVHRADDAHQNTGRENGKEHDAFVGG